LGRDICIIVNPQSGGDGTDRIAQVEAALADAGVTAAIRPMEPGQSPGAAARAAVVEGFGTIVAAGGDGTISGVADALLRVEPEVRLGVLPFGTFNFFARGLGLPLDPAEAAGVLVQGRVRAMHFGTVNGRAFLNNMSIGLYPSILENREDLYDRWGRSRLAAYWSVLKTVTGFNPPMRLDLRLDGRQDHLTTPLAFVAASAFQLETYNLDGADEVREGALALFAVKRTQGRDLMRSAWALARGQARKGEEFEMRIARDIEIRPRAARVLVARDGEREWMETPLGVVRSDRAVPVLAGASA
jgi:diacylglycerol kinase family enzyme